MVTALIGGVAVAAAAYAGRYGIQAWQAFKARPPTARLRKFYEGGFQSTMTKREAALILGVRPHSAPLTGDALALARFCSGFIFIRIRRDHGVPAVDYLTPSPSSFHQISNLRIFKPDMG